MSKEMYISSSPHETKVAVLEDDQLVEVYFERDTDVGLVGGIYKGRVSRVLPGMQSAFVDIGLERDAFLYVSDFYEDQEEYDKVFEEAEARATKFTTQQAGGAPPAAPPAAAVEAEIPAPVVAEVAPPTVAPLVAPPAPEQPAATVASPTPVFTPHPPRDSHESRGFDPKRGRRRRHRGRPEFAEHRPADRKFAPPTRSEEPPTESHAFEILPGESLAKYRNASSGPVEELATEYAEGTRSEFSTDGIEAVDEGNAPNGEAAALEAVAAPVDASPAVETVTEASEDQPAIAAVAPSEPRDEDTIVVADEPAPFTPGAIYSRIPSTGVETASAAINNPILDVPVPLETAPLPAEPEHTVEVPASSVSSAAEAAAAYSPEGIAAPSSGEDESSQAAPESPSERAELEVPEEDSDNEEEGLDEGEELEEGAEAELLAESTEGQLGDQGERPASVAAADGEGQPSSQEAAAGDASATGAPGDRTYTLREPSQRPRFAPRRRRGRRGGPGGGGDRGPRRPEGRREPQRSGGNHHPVQIAEVLKEGQEILVQIAKEPLGTKGARITSHVALPGRYLVYMPTISHIGVSRKISSEEERLRLRNIIQENKGSLTGGFIVRTASQGRSEEEFKADLKFLSTLWAEIRAKHDRLKAPALIHRDLDLVQRLLRDLLTPDFKCVRVDSEIDYERVLDFVNRCQPALVGKVKLYSRDTPLYEEFGIQAELDKALKPKVWLKSGGYIVINQTEALVAVDVNTGKFVGKTNRLEDTIVKTNVDAVNEIVRQVRLRDLGGIIVIDFIDMDERKNRAKVVQALEEALRSDRAPTKVIAFNDFGLVAVTRKRVKQSLERTLCVPCAYCTGSGWVKSVNTVCNEIMAEVRKMAKGIDGNVLTLRVNPEVAKHLKSREGNLVSELESMTKKDVIIKGDPTVHQERFEIY
jgi:Rne/Rng family ribonuclease